MGSNWKPIHLFNKSGIEQIIITTQSIKKKNVINGKHAKIPRLDQQALPSLEHLLCHLQHQNRIAGMAGLPGILGCADNCKSASHDN